MAIRTRYIVQCEGDGCTGYLVSWTNPRRTVASEWQAMTFPTLGEADEAAVKLGWSDGIAGASAPCTCSDPIRRGEGYPHTYDCRKVRPWVGTKCPPCRKKERP